MSASRPKRAKSAESKTQRTASIRKIGLSLGADICWPICFEDIVADLDLDLPIKGENVRFELERVPIEPFDNDAPRRYDLVIDRLTHWYHTRREWIKKVILMDGTYVFNNPWSVQSMEKQTSYCAMRDLGMPIPKTWLLPPKEYDDAPDLDATLKRYARLFDLGEIGKQIGYPLFMKPYDGGGWVGVTKADNEEELRAAYEESGKFVMHLQEGILPYERFVRCVGLGPQVRIISYDPSAPPHERYQTDASFITPADRQILEDTTLTINAFFGWDFNSCESLLKDGTWHPIDFANPCPDAQVTSLHYHFPWMLRAKLRWALYCAATRRPMRQSLDWTGFYKIRDRGLPFAETLAEYGKLARKRLNARDFESFCKTHLGQLDQVLWDYFGSDRARVAVGLKVQALFPEQEWEQFTEHFWQAIQTWRADETPQKKATRKS
ncbi:MAG: hypothetical protein ACI8QZ_000656 [Chlamydiales bacterium]|jgi:hypothetical protein